jgi:hypothetical protein
LQVPSLKFKVKTSLLQTWDLQLRAEVRRGDL